MSTIKRLLIPLLLLIGYQSYAQDNISFDVHQGYIYMDTTLSIFNEADYTFRIVKDSLYLPYRTVAITSKEVVYLNGLPVSQMKLSDGSFAQYSHDASHGHIISIEYSNGRWMMWQIPQKLFKLNVPTQKSH